MNNGIIYKEMNKVPEFFKVGWVIVSDRAPNLVVNTGKGYCVISLRNYHGSSSHQCGNRAMGPKYSLNKNDLWKTVRSDGSTSIILAIYDSIESWIKDGAPGL